MSYPTVVTVEMMRGDARQMKVTAKDEDGQLLPLTGLTISYVISKKVGAEALTTKTIGSGITVTDAPNGAFTIDLLKSDTSTKIGEHYHECQLVGADPQKPYTLFTGSITFQKDQIT